MTVVELEQIALNTRRNVVDMIYRAGSGHLAGSLSSTDIFTTIFFKFMKYDPKKPLQTQRDRFIISCGHYAPALYATMAQAGFFPKDELATFRKIGSRLQGHPHNKSLPGVEVSSGPIGQGLSQAIGMALASRLDNSSHKIYCLMSDGEHNEGQLWEAVMFASKEKINNIVNIVDRNNIQIDGYTEDVMPLESLKDKYEAFNWHVIEVDGNDIASLIKAIDEVNSYQNGPSVIIANTVAGKGVDFMENDYHWHSGMLNEEQYQQAMIQLEAK